MSEPSDRGFLPDFCAIRSVFVVVVSVELLAIVLTLAAFPGADAFWGDLALKSLYTQWIGLCVAALLCLFKRPLARLRAGLCGLLAWCLILLVTSAVFAGARQLGLLGGDVGWLLLAQHLGIAGIVGAMVLRYLYEQFRERQRELAESRARLAALQARIRPHFLFNSMNTIASLTRVDPALAEQTVQDLADLLRASLADADGLTTVDGELAIARGYLRIEQQRLGERLDVAWEVGDGIGRIPLPPLLLQPLIENAVYHGVETSVGGATIRVAARVRDGRLQIDVENTVGPPGAPSHRQGNHMAQANVRERLDALYGEDAQMRLVDEPGRYRVELSLPVAPA
jgi:two-component system sensor histidine kinase AlgZ